MNHINLRDVYIMAPGLNIEGGLPYTYLVRDNPNKNPLWVNLILMLDRPLIDNILFSKLDEIMKMNSYPLLENTIDALNEHKMFAIYLMTIGYYLEYGRSFMNLKDDDELHIVIHMHQDIASKGFLELIQKHLIPLCEFFKLDNPNTHISYRTDTPIFIATEHSYENTDILISLSQCAGLSRFINPGDMIISDTFIPYDVANKKIIQSKKYNVKNHLIETYKDIVESNYNVFSVHYINNHYKSKNPRKYVNTAKLIKYNDFIIKPILQVDALWNPESDMEILEII